QNGLDVPVGEIQRRFYGPGTRAAVLALQRQSGLTATGQVDATTTSLILGAPAPNVVGAATSAPVDPRARLSIPVGSLPAPPSTPQTPPPAPPTAANAAQVSGRIFTDDGNLASAATLRVYSRGLGGASVLLGETKTDAQGTYALSYAPPDGGANLEV